MKDKTTSPTTNSERETEERIRAAGFDSADFVRSALANLRRRREAIIDRHIGASSIGNAGFEGGIPVDQWQRINDAIDDANSLPQLEADIERLVSLLR